MNDEDQKLLCPFFDREGGPVENNVSEQNSAEWNSNLEDSSIEMKTEDIRIFFPEKFVKIES